MNKCNFIFPRLNRSVNNNFSTDTEVSRYLSEKNLLGSDHAQSDAAQLAAFAAASARDGALIDLKDLNQHINSRRLLSDKDYDYLAMASDENNSSQEQPKKLSQPSGGNTNSNNKSLPSLEKKRGYNLTKKSNESMELVLINGTWHLIDLNVCYNMLRAESENSNQFFLNNTHINK